MKIMIIIIMIIMIINNWAIPLVRYLGLFLKWTRDELILMDQRIRKLRMMNKALHARDDTEGLYASRKKKEEEESPALKIVWMNQYTGSKSREKLIAVVSNSSDNIKTNRTITSKQKWGGEKLYRYIWNDKLAKFLTRRQRKGNIKRETGSLLIAV